MATRLIVGESMRQAADITQYRSTKMKIAGTVQSRCYVRRQDFLEELKSRSLGLNSKLPLILNDRYLLEEHIGSGGMGLVFKSRDLKPVKPTGSNTSSIAIKILSEQFKSDPQARKYLRSESSISKRIAHPNIVRVFDFENDGGIPFITMEYVEGKALDVILEHNRYEGLPEQIAQGLIEALASALSQVHSQQIVHSDLKPGNILVTDEGAPKIVDFGLSQAIDARPSPIPDDLNTLNPGYLAAFTPAYASREIIKGYQPDFSDDVFALGCIAYELFSGVHPYQKVPADQAEIQGLKAKRIPNITRHQWTAIRKAIAFRREKRTPTATVFYQDISVGG